MAAPSGFYHRTITVFLILFVVLWLYWGLNYHEISLLKTGGAAAGCSFTITVVIAISLRFLQPAIHSGSPKQRMARYKAAGGSVRIMGLFTAAVPIFAGILWMAEPLFPLWKMLAAGLLLGFVTSLPAVVIIKWILRNYKGEDKKQRFSFRDEP